MDKTEHTESKNFIEEIVERDIAADKYPGGVVTRFPPEPNGYLHIGHAKSIALNFGLAATYGGKCHLRFDDTNPTTEDPEFVESIQNDIRWLGYDWGEDLYYASDYFGQLYDYAVDLIKKKSAYVDSQTGDEIRLHRGTVTEPGKESPYRSRSVEENLRLFEEMRAGKHADGSHVLRAKLDMSDPNMKLRDPLLYRIKHAHHYRTGDEWCIYPMYDFAHPLSDAIENITHSLCTLEFENNRPVYDWVVDEVRATHDPSQNDLNNIRRVHDFVVGGGPPRPYQYEFARLGINYFVTSKRKLKRLVEEGFVDGWDDPRMYTLAGLRRRGYTPSSVRYFVEKVGVARANSRSDVGLLEYSIRNDLNMVVPRVMAVLNPLKVEIVNYTDGEVEWLDAPYYPHDVPKDGTRKVPFSKHVYIDRSDFQEHPQKKFYRLSPGNEVRLRYGYVIRCTDVVKDAAGNILSLKCTHDPETRNGDTPDGRKVKGTIQWVSADHALEFEARLYDRLFNEDNPEDGVEDFTDNINPESKTILAKSYIEPSVAKDPSETRYQFEREGYFWRDPVDSTADHLVFNRIVTLRDSWAKAEARRESARRGAGSSKSVVSEVVSEDPATEHVSTIEDSPEVIAFSEGHGLPLEIARQLFHDEAKRELFKTSKKIEPELSTSLANWIVNDLPTAYSSESIAPLLVQLLSLIEDGTISTQTGKELQSEIFESGEAPASIVERKGLAQLSDPEELKILAAAVIANNAEKAAAYRSGKTGLIGFFIGQVMKASGGKANPELVRSIIEKKLS